MRDEKRIIPSVAYLQGQYGYNHLCLGVPAILGGNGIENIVELDLLIEEKEALQVSASVVKELIDICD
ncbi:hypothetical protein [Solibacillus daqui]|uniref:hypothetical protein n=1 Tax=Solibacillus daqui TaxID=2912187 RepID=UPI0023669186|nr:hypothetical protein [Solibacillus daqui]